MNGKAYFLSYGYSAKQTFLTDATNLFAFNVVAYLYFLKPFLKSEKQYKKISIFAVIMCGLYLLISIITLLMTFSFITETDEMLSVYLVTRLISFGRFFQRIDAVFIFVWILVILSFLSLNLYIISYIIKKTLHLKSNSEIVYPAAAWLFFVTLIFKDISSVKFITSSIYRYYAFVLVFIITLLILLFAYNKYKRKKGVPK